MHSFVAGEIGRYETRSLAFGHSDTNYYLDVLKCGPDERPPYLCHLSLTGHPDFRYFAREKLVCQLPDLYPYAGYSTSPPGVVPSEASSSSSWAHRLTVKEQVFYSLLRQYANSATDIAIVEAQLSLARLLLNWPRTMRYNDRTNRRTVIRSCWRKRLAPLQAASPILILQRSFIF